MPHYNEYRAKLWEIVQEILNWPVDKLHKNLMRFAKLDDKRALMPYVNDASKFTDVLREFARSKRYENILKAAIPSADLNGNKSEFYGFYHNRMEEFEFEEGDKTHLSEILRVITSKINARQWNMLCSLAQGRNICPVVVNCESRPFNKDEEIGKIRKNLKNSHKEGLYEERYKEAMENIEINVYLNQKQEYEANITCPFCAKKLSTKKYVGKGMKRSGKGNWVLSNFTKHINRKHPSLRLHSPDDSEEQVDINQNQAQPSQQNQNEEHPSDIHPANPEHSQNVQRPQGVQQPQNDQQFPASTDDQETNNVQEPLSIQNAVQMSNLGEDTSITIELANMMHDQRRDSLQDASNDSGIGDASFQNEISQEAH